MAPLEPDQEKIARCKNVLLENYLNASVVEKAVNTIDYSVATHGDLDFLKFGRWNFIPRDWFTDPAIYPDMVFSDIGRGIALGEKRHIVETILADSQIRRTDLETINYRNIREVVTSMFPEVDRTGRTIQFILFAPIEYFVNMHVDWMREHGVLLQQNRLPVDDFWVQIFWSNKYLDYKDFIILERSFCRWIAKPNVRNRLQVQIGVSERPESMELKAQTVFNFKIVHPEKIRILHPTRVRHAET